MLNCSLTLTANAGIILEWNHHVIWIDALHSNQVPGFSTVSPALWQQMQTELPPPELFCFTHCHPDHYSRQIVSEAHSLWPAAKLLLPQQDFPDQILLFGREVRLTAGNLTLRFLRLPHEGGMDIQHYGLLLSNGSSHILIASDCEIASATLSQYLEGIPIDLAVLNFPWLTLHRGRRYLEDILSPRHLLLCHLPFPEDDINGYLKAARHAAESAALPDIRLLTQPLQKELIL